MFEAYSLGVRLTVDNQISPVLKLLSVEFKKLDGLVVGFSQSLAQLNTDVAGLRKVTTSANAANKAFEKANLNAAAFSRHIASIGAGMSSIPKLPGYPSGGASGSGGGGRGGKGPAGGIHGGNIHVGPGGIGLGTAGFAAGDWFWPMAATGAAAYAGSSLFDAAKSLDIERQRFKLLGMTPAQNAQAFGFVDNMRVYGTTRAENQAAFNEAQGVGRESGLAGTEALRFAMIAAPTLAQLDAIGIGLDDESKAALHQQNIALLRAVEQSGGLRGSDEVKRLANDFYKLRQSSGGTIDYEQIRAVTAKGGAYTQSMSDIGWAHAEPLIQELKGSAYGVGISQAGNRLFGVLSRTPKNLITDAIRFGLWTPDRHKLSEADAKLFKEDFVQFYLDRVLPGYNKAGLSANDQIRENTVLFNTTGARIGNLISKSLPAIQKSPLAMNAAKGIDAATAQLPETLSGQQKEFEAAWTDFKTNFGTTALPFFTGILKAGSTILRAINGNKDTVAGFKGLASAPLDLMTGNYTGLGQDAKKFWNFIGTLSKKDTTFMLNADAKKMGITVTPIVTQQQAKAFSAPQTGLSGFDTSMSLMPAGGVQ